MADTYTGECKICHEETDLIQGICEDCFWKETDKIKVDYGWLEKYHDKYFEIKL